MDWLILERLESGNQGTFGRLLGKNFSFFSGELPWRENASNISCIHAGVYHCVPTYSPMLRTTAYLVSNVHGRSGIRIHAANFMGSKLMGLHCQLNGCIALGEKMGIMDGQKAILISRPAVKRFEMLMKLKPFVLEIKDVP